MLVLICRCTSAVQKALAEMLVLICSYFLVLVSFLKVGCSLHGLLWLAHVKFIYPLLDIYLESFRGGV